MNKFKSVLSVISAAVMSGLCVVSNLTIANADYNTEYPATALEDTNAQWSELYSQFDESECSVDLNNITTVPTSCDLSTNADKKYLPPIGNQGGIGSCVAWATTYYQYSYAANKLNGINSTSSTAYSPSWTYNYINSGENIGTFVTDAYDILKKHGALTMAEMPYNGNPLQYDYSWSTDTSAMVKALDTRISYCDEVTIPSNGTAITSKNDADLKEAKLLLSTGHILVINVSANSGMSNWSFKDCYNVQNKKVAYRASVGIGGHAMAVIGYNDNITCDVNGNGTIEASERGAFKIANSWGTDWENSGYIWVMYDALNGVSANTTNNWEASESGTRISAFSRSLYNVNRFNFIEVKNYDVNLVGMLTLDTNYRYNFQVNLFRNNNSSTGYTDSLNYFNSEYNNSNHSYNGSLLFDYSEYANPVSIATNGYFFGVDVINRSDSGVINHVAYKIVDNKLNTVKTMSNMQNTSISNNRNKRGSVKIQCTQNDITYDDSVNTEDLLLLIEYCMGNIEFSNLQYYLADFNEDGEVNEADAKGLSRYIATHSSKNEVKKVMALNQRLTDYMKVHNYDKAEISEIEKLNDSISKEII